MRQSTTVYSFAFGLSQPLSKRNAHDQLYTALMAEKGDWYKPRDEARCIQFVQKVNDTGQAFLICRSNTQPTNTNLFFKENVISVATGETIKVDVRLPAMRRLVQQSKTRMKPILDGDKESYYGAILERFGMRVNAVGWASVPASTIFFTKKSRKVTIPVDDVTAQIEVIDAELFIQAFRSGVGRYKTYGCGMIHVN